MSFFDQDYAGHDLADTAIALTERLQTLNFSQVIPLEDVMLLAIQIGHIQLHTATLRKHLGTDYRKTVPIIPLAPVPYVAPSMEAFPITCDCADEVA